MSTIERFSIGLVPGQATALVRGLTDSALRKLKQAGGQIDTSTKAYLQVSDAIMGVAAKIGPVIAQIESSRKIFYAGGLLAIIGTMVHIKSSDDHPNVKKAAKVMTAVGAVIAAIGAAALWSATSEFFPLLEELHDTASWLS